MFIIAHAQIHCIDQCVGWRWQNSWTDVTLPMTLSIYLVLTYCIKVCKVVYRLTITWKLNLWDHVVANPSIQRYWIDQNRSLEDMHFWKKTRRMTKNNWTNDSVHLFHSVCIYAGKPSSGSTTTWERNRAYSGSIAKF